MSTTIFAYTRYGQTGKWSRWLLPYAVDYFAQLGNVLHIRSGDTILKLDATVASDDVDGVPLLFGGTVQWGWLNFGSAGGNKMLEGFDIVSVGAPSISIGYDQRDLALFTAPYAIDPDTLSGGIIPMAVNAPTMSVKVTFAPGTPWKLSAMQLSFFDTAN